MLASLRAPCALALHLVLAPHGDTRAPLLLALLLGLGPSALGQVLLKEITGPPKSQRLGYILELDVDQLLVGNPLAGDDDHGLAWLFDVRTGNVDHKLVSGQPRPGGDFGRAVGMTDRWIVVGAPGEDLTRGAVYLFDRRTGEQLARLRGELGDRSFGSSLAVAPGRLLVRTQARNAYTAGAVRVYDLPSLAYRGQLMPDDLHRYMDFGRSLSVFGDTAAIGAPGWSTPGAVYLFDLETGLQRRKIPQPPGGDLFGIAVDLRATRLLVGDTHDEAQGQGAGAAHLFDAWTGAPLRKFVAPDGDEDDGLGMDLLLRGRRAVVGAIDQDAGGTNSGAAYVFDVETGQLLTKLTPPEPEPFDRFGVAVSASAGRLVVGAPTVDSQGTMYVYDLLEPVGTATCGPAALNSTGRSGALNATGSEVVRANLLRLEASALPPGRPGLFLASPTRALVPFVGGSQGHLCLGRPLGRDGPLLQSDAAGRFARYLDLQELPQPGGEVAAQAGETWNFQAWYRDLNPGPTSNLTDAVGLTLE